MLLLAALLHLAGAAALPVLHDLASVPSSSGQPALVAVLPDGEEAPSAPAHDESTCLVCQAAHTLGALPGGAEIFLPTEREAPARAELFDPRPAQRDAATLARAPPAPS